jgi:hypothetical protein
VAPESEKPGQFRRAANALQVETPLMAAKARKQLARTNNSQFNA